MIGPIPQDQDYHRFADSRAFLGIENAADVLSNLPFILVGIAGLLHLWRNRGGGDLSAYWVLFGAAALVGVGSIYYHLAPSDSRLVWDRLPIAVIFMSLLAAIISERIHARAGRTLLVPLVLLGVASVLYWAAFDDLRLYGVVQFGAIAAMLVIAAFYRSPYAGAELIFAAGALYGLAKLCEFTDRAIFEFTTGFVSGHTLKHLLAAAALYVMVWSLQQRTRRYSAGEFGA
jgi:hypothetical protein